MPGRATYKVQVMRGRKLVERNCFEKEADAERHFAFLEHRYLNVLHDFNVKISIVYNKQFLKSI